MKQDQGSKAPSAVHYITVKALTKLSSKLFVEIIRQNYRQNYRENKNDT